jgi:hypothetical protein
MKTKVVFTVAATLFAAVTPSPSSVLQAADEKAPAYDAGQPISGAPMDDQQLQRLAWGPPATNGLRVAFYFEPTKEAYVDGEVVEHRVVFHNCGKEPVRFTAAVGTGSDRMTVVDDQGRQVPLDRLWHYGKLVLRTYRLEPGHGTEIKRSSVGLGASAKAGSPADTAIQAKPGTTCRARWLLHVTDADPHLASGKPAPGATLALKTGEVRFRITGKEGGASVGVRSARGSESQ